MIVTANRIPAWHSLSTGSDLHTEDRHKVTQQQSSMFSASVVPSLYLSIYGYLAFGVNTQESGSPVPEPMAPMKSAMMVKAPMHMPPKAAAVGMYRLSSFLSDCTVSRWPCHGQPGSQDAASRGQVLRRPEPMITLGIMQAGPQ